MPTPSAGTPITLVDDSAYNAFPVAARADNGDLLILYAANVDHVTPGTEVLLRSTDGAATWDVDGALAGAALTAVSGGVLLRGAWKEAPGAYSQSRRSVDNGVTWATAVDVPHPWDTQGLVESFVECANGDVLALSYGKDAADTHYSVSQARSTDRGQSWTDEGVIFDGQADSKMYAEPQAICLDNGALLCMIRSDTGTPTIYSATSTDQGATWSAPSSAFAATGRPSCYQARDDTVLCMYRSNAGAGPTRFRSSDDRGATWSAEADFTGGSTLKMMYGAFFPLPTGRTGAVYATEVSTTNTDVYWVELATGVGPVGGHAFWHDTPTTTGTGEHNDLDGRDADDAHPMSAITGLGAALDAVDEALADLDGRWEVVVAGTAPPVAVTTEAEDDWLYTFIPN